MPDQDGNSGTGLDDTIVPVDFETRGMLDSGTLHRHLVTNLAQGSTLFIVLDCCHSGSAVELPYVYRSDEDGNVNSTFWLFSLYSFPLSYEQLIIDNIKFLQLYLRFTTKIGI